MRFGLRSLLKNKLSTPNRDALWIFGSPKSGTTAIANLLAEQSGKSVTLDTSYLWEPYLSQLINKEISFANHINKYSYPFSKQIIKEPAASFLYEDIRNYFHLESFVFIVRNPFDNIKSILNRLNLPGNNKKLSMDEIPLLWRWYLTSSKSDNYIEAMALKWLEVNSNIELLENNGCQLINYEQFKGDRERIIGELSKKLNFTVKHSITDIKNIQYQPKGKDQDNQTFFGKVNYQIIMNVCGDQMKYFGYQCA